MATTSLTEVVQQLQLQNDTLVDVKDSIKQMLSEDIKRRKGEESNKGDKEEERREKSNQKAKASRPKQKPATSFKQGALQGIGIADMFKGMGSGAGLLGGFTLGGLVGRAAGKLFFPAIAAMFGASYVDKWTAPLVDKIVGDDKVWEIFGKEFDASKLVAGLGLGLAAIFAKPLITTAASGALGLGTSRGAMLRTMFVRKIGLAGIGLALAGTLGTAMENLTGSTTVGDLTKYTVMGASIGSMFGPTGTLIGAAAGFAIGGAFLIRDYYRKVRLQQKADFEKEVNLRIKKEGYDQMSDQRLIALATNTATNSGRNAALGIAQTPDQIEDEAAQLKALEAKNPAGATAAFISEEIGFRLAELQQNFLASPGGNVIPGSMTGDINALKKLYAEHKALTGLDNLNKDALAKYQRLNKSAENQLLTAPVFKGQMFQPKFEIQKVRSFDPNGLMSPKSTTTSTINIGQVGNNSNATSTSSGGGGRSSGGMGSPIDYHYLTKHSMQLGGSLYSNAGQLTF